MRIWEAEGKPEGQADRHWSRAAEDVDREDSASHREGISGEKPGVRPQGDADFAQDKSYGIGFSRNILVIVLFPRGVILILGEHHGCQRRNCPA
jgi:hypothetical protein